MPRGTRLPEFVHLIAEDIYICLFGKDIYVYIRKGYMGIYFRWDGIRKELGCDTCGGSGLVWFFFGVTLTVYIVAILCDFCDLTDLDGSIKNVCNIRCTVYWCTVYILAVQGIKVYILAVQGINIPE